MSNIPELSRKHVLLALQQIDEQGVPEQRNASRYALIHGKRRYPPKYVVSLASQFATGRELPPDEFYGGRETNTLLETLGFQIVSRSEAQRKTTRSRAPVVEPALPAMAEVPVEARRSARTKALPSAQRISHPKGIQVVRLVTKGSPPKESARASQLLLQALGRKWPTDAVVPFMLTPGGFLSGSFPTNYSGNFAWDSRPKDLDPLIREAERIVRQTLSQEVLAAAPRRVKYLTLGVDLVRADDAIVELVAVIDCDSGRVIRWTGKSYPTGWQEQDLVQVVDLSSHFIELAGERVMVLGCHDLNMFSNRGRANQNEGGLRRQRCDAMRARAKAFRPTLVLQHPHSTDTPNIWAMPWACLQKYLPSVRTFASGIAFFNPEGARRAELDVVLRRTASPTGVFDISI